LSLKEGIWLQTHTGEVTCELEGRDWDDVFTAMNPPKTARKHQKLSQRQGRFYPKALRKKQSFNTLISDF
jgi:hypothetical protein